MSEGRMTAEQTPVIEAVLAEHRPRHLAQDAFHTPVTCICGPGWNRDQHPTWEAHVADRLAARTSTATADDRYRKLYDRYNDLYAKWLKVAHPWCICEEGPYFGAQQAGTPLRCERCGRDETATADTGLRERVEALADEARDRKRAFPSHPHWAAWDFYERDLRDALDATAAPTTDHRSPR